MMKKMMSAFSLFITGCFLCTAVVAQENKSNVSADERGYIVTVGQRAPDFTIEYLDGTKVQLSSLRGKIVMLQFTASWCSVCRQEMPHIEKDIWLKHKNNPNFVLLGIDLKESAEVTAKFISDIKISYQITLDTDGSRFALFCDPKAGVTRNIIIDKTGKMVMLTRLFDEKEFGEMVTLIDTLLK
jgi:peroxiredoxin